MPETLGATQLIDLSGRFEERLQATKNSVQPRDFDWYPYDSFSVISLFQSLLSRAPGGLLDLVGGLPVADIGCADGDISFLLESLGCKVDAIDNAATNYNRLLGVQALKERLNSHVEIHDIDLDTQFLLPRDRYGLAVFMGILYHLKNPYYALEKLSRSARYCLLSTRIAKFAPGGVDRIEDMPIAFLLGDRESNDDATNYWIFSDSGLRRILDRTGWNILTYIKTGSERSEPVSLAADERAFCFLESRNSMEFPTHCDLVFLQGWHAVEQGGWRWTEKRFAALIRPGDRVARTIRLALMLHESTFRDAPTVTLSARVNGIELAPQLFARPGRDVYSRTLPESCRGSRELLIEFELGRALPPDGADERELGLIVSSMGIE